MWEQRFLLRSEANGLEQLVDGAVLLLPAETGVTHRLANDIGGAKARIER